MSAYGSKIVATHFTAAPPMPEFRIGQLKRSTANYLDSYQRHRHVAISRGVFPPSERLDEDINDEELPSQSEDSDEQLLDRLEYTRKEAADGLSQLLHQLSRVSEALKARKRIVWVRSGIFGICSIAILSTLTHDFYNLRAKLLRWLPSFLLDWFPFVLSSLGALPMMFHERRISCTTTALDRVYNVLNSVKLSESVQKHDVEWIAAEDWEGVDWAIVGL